MFHSCSPTNNKCDLYLHITRIPDKSCECFMTGRQSARYNKTIYTYGSPYPYHPHFYVCIFLVCYQKALTLSKNEVIFHDCSRNKFVHVRNNGSIFRCMRIYRFVSRTFPSGLWAKLQCNVFMELFCLDLFPHTTPRPPYFYKLHCSFYLLCLV